MQRWLAEAIDAAALRLQARSAQLQRRTIWPDPEELRALQDRQWNPPPLDNPGTPPNVERIRIGMGPAGADEAFWFESSPPFAQGHDRSVQGLLYLPPDPARGAVILAPGAFTGAGGHLTDRIYPQIARTFGELGLAVARLMLPLHERRAPPGEVSGHNLLHGDIFTYVRGLSQAVRDARATIGWLQDDFGKVGYWGLSLGAGIGALVTAHDPRLAFAVLLEPPLRTDAAFKSPLTRIWRTQLRESGVTDSDISAILHAVEPHGPPAIAPEQILLQGGRWDRLAPPDGIERLAERWGGPTVRWYPDGHISMLMGRRPWLRDAVEFASAAVAD